MRSHSRIRGRRSDTYTMDPTDLERAIETSHGGVPKAVIPVHLYGQPADLRSISAIARHNGASRDRGLRPSTRWRRYRAARSELGET